MWYRLKDVSMTDLHHCQVTLDTGIGETIQLGRKSRKGTGLTVRHVVDSYLAQFDQPSCFQVKECYDSKGVAVKENTSLDLSNQFYVKLRVDKIVLTVLVDDAHYVFNATCGQLDTVRDVVCRELRLLGIDMTEFRMVTFTERLSNASHEESSVDNMVWNESHYFIHLVTDIEVLAKFEFGSENNVMALKMGKCQDVNDLYKMGMQKLKFNCAEYVLKGVNCLGSMVKVIDILKDGMTYTFKVQKITVNIRVDLLRPSTVTALPRSISLPPKAKVSTLLECLHIPEDLVVGQVRRLSTKFSEYVEVFVDDDVVPDALYRVTLNSVMSKVLQSVNGSYANHLEPAFRSLNICKSGVDKSFDFETKLTMPGNESRSKNNASFSGSSSESSISDFEVMESIESDMD